MAGFLGGLYSTVFKRNFIFLGVVFTGAFATEILFETTANGIWDQINRGRQWKDIKQRYMGEADD